MPLVSRNLKKGFISPPTFDAESYVSLDLKTSHATTA
jgi:hypothetical protein